MLFFKNMQACCDNLHPAVMQKKKMELDPHLSPNIQNLKWIKNLNIRAKTIKLLEDNRGINLHD